MMRKVIYATAIAIAAACNSGEKITAGGAKDKASPSSENTSQLEPTYCEELLNANQLELDEKVLQEVTVLDYRLKEACICIVYQYSGCEEVPALLTWNGEWPSEFHPVIPTSLRVVNAGMCDMLLTDSACYSIKKFSFGGDQVDVTINGQQNRLSIDFTRYQ